MIFVSDSSNFSIPEGNRKILNSLQISVASVTATSFIKTKLNILVALISFLTHIAIPSSLKYFLVISLLSLY